MSELKCCPFCGGEAKYIEIKDFFISRFVTCTKCGIETKRNYLNKADAVKQWNTRSPMANIVEKLEEESYETTDTVCGGRFKAIRLSSAINIVNQEINKEN